MRNILTVLALLACVSPALAAGEQTKLLFDADSNLTTAEWKISSAEWGGKSPWKVALRTLHGGRQEGVQVIEVDNGVLTFTIVPEMPMLQSTHG